MGVLLKKEDIIPDEVSIFNKFIYIRKCFFLILFSFYIIYLSKISFKRKFICKNYKNLNSLSKLDYSEVSSVLKTKSNLFLKFLSDINFYDDSSKKNFFLRTFNNVFFVFPDIWYQKKSFFFDNLILTFGTRNVGFRKTKHCNYLINYSPDINKINVFVNFTFPYFFMKFFFLLDGLKNILEIEIHPLFLIVSSKNSFKYLWIVEKCKFSKMKKFFQICKLFQNNFEFIAYNKILSSSEIMFAMLKKNKIESWKINFNKNKIFSNLEMCGISDCSREGKIISFFWGGIFSRCLFLGDAYGKVVLLNEILCPILRIKIYSFFGKNFLNLNDFTTIVVILNKKIGKKIQKKKTILKKMPQSILMIFVIEKNHIKTFSYLLNVLNFVKFKIKPKYSKELVRKLNKISIFFEHFKICKYFSKIIFFNCNSIKYSNNSLNILIFFHKLMRKIFSRFLNFYFSLSIFGLKNFLFCILLISKVRFLSLMEIELDQLYILSIFKRFFYRKCKFCKRISKFWFRYPLKSYLCLFSHRFITDQIMMLCPEKYSSERNCQIQKKFFGFSFGTEISNLKLSKRLLLQKEIKCLAKHRKK